MRGELPEEVEVASPTGAANGALDIGGYYVAFLFKGVVDASIKQFEGDSRRLRLDADELSDFGGETSIFLGRYLWAVDGDTAYHIPVEHLITQTASPLTDLDVAKAEGERMALADLEAMLRPPDE